MRLFNIEVFNGTIQGTNINVTSTELQEVLGRADVIILEIEVMRATAGAQLNKIGSGTRLSWPVCAQW